MTGKQRMLTAFRNKEMPDMVPVSPDVSNMYPCKYAGKPFWNIYYYQNPPLWKAYLNVTRKFKFEAWLPIFNSLGSSPEEPEISEKIIEKSEERLEIEFTFHTKKGDLIRVIIFPKNEPVWESKPLTTSPETDYDKVLCLFVDPWTYDINTGKDFIGRKTDNFRTIYETVGDTGVVGVDVTLPFDWWKYTRGDTIESIMDFHDEPKLMKKLICAYTENTLEYIKAACELLHPDEIKFGGSCSSMSLISPQMFRDINLPFIEKATKICKDYGIVSHQHVCGKSKEVVEMLSHTDLNVMEPLERSPTGNIDLKEIKKRYGSKFCLKGNVHTIETMLNGSTQDVEMEVKRCIQDAGENGGFILSTGDQVPHMTPEENMIAFVEAGRKYGKYHIEQG